MNTYKELIVWQKVIYDIPCHPRGGGDPDSHFNLKKVNFTLDSRVRGNDEQGEVMKMLNKNISSLIA